MHKPITDNSISSKNFSQRLLIQQQQPETNNETNKQVSIKYVIIHFTEMPLVDALQRLCDPLAEVSCHYLISATGTIYQLVDEQYKAWHAGVSYWKADEQLNNNSIGIEIDNNGKEHFTDQQIDKVIALCQYLKIKYNILTQNFLGHADIAPNRKIDPGIFFPWQKLALSQIGLWPQGQYTEVNQPLYNLNDQNTAIANLQSKLQKLGYKINITAIYDKQTSDVVRTFKAHFQATEIHDMLNIEEYFNLDSVYLWSRACEWQLDQLLLMIQ